MNGGQTRDSILASATRRINVLALLGDGEGHTTAEINSAEVGGTEGTRRVRELRRDGYHIESRKRAGSTQWEYRWVGVDQAADRRLMAATRIPSVDPEKYQPEPVGLG